MKRLLPFSLPVIVFFSLIACIPADQNTQTAATRLIPPPPLKRLSEVQYGIEVNDRHVVHDEVQRNQFLSDILTAHNVAYAKIDQIARNREVFDVRRIRVGNSFTLLLNRENCAADYFIYEKSRASYVVFDMSGDEVSVYEGQKPVTRQEKEASGVIRSSMYSTILENGFDVSLAAKLEDTYGWAIDFFYLQKGDFFKIVYEEEFVEGESIGISRILGATFHHRGKDFHALHFDQDGVADYFDEEGNSLRKAFLKAPLKYSRISSHFSRSRFHPILKYHRPHLGVDYAAPHGTPILAVGDGIVSEATRAGGNGNYVKIKHNSMYATQYLHMSGFAKGIHPGVAVRQGDVIGYVGSTGLATGPHVCFRFWKNGEQVNPLAIEAPPSEPIKDAHRDHFASAWAVMARRLSSIPVVDTEEPVFASSQESASQPEGGP